MSAYQNRLSRRTSREPVSGTKTDDRMKTRTGGMPLNAATRSTLESGFGHSLSDIRIYADDHADQLSRGFDADAFTVGQDIFFAQGHYDPGSESGRHLLTHEVAHAVQQRGARADDFSGLAVSSRHSRSETEAHAATHAVMRGKPAHVSASAGPMVSRWESGEHKRAVDGANIPEEMKGKIKLANGLEVTPGEITAMMGDLYGRFDKEVGADGKEVNHFNPAKSFDQMNNADPKEMAAMLKLIDHEAAHPKELTDSSEWEKITRNRKDGDDSYLELAKKNNSHFSAPDAKGTDNNMGAYSAFHQMALEAAKNGDMEKARALEASGDHYLTDRFSAGHNFEKNGVMAASGHESGGILANMAVKTAHDDMNENGTTLHNANGDNWKAYGDANWDRDENADNRTRTQQAVAGSWNELAQADPNHKSSPGDKDAKFDVNKSVPQFDPKNQERAEAVARNTSVGDILWNYGSSAPGAIAGSLWRTEGQIENGLSDAWDWTKGKAGQAYDWAGDKANQAWDAGGRAANWVGHEAVAGAHAVENGARAVGREVADDAKWVGHEAVQGAKAVGGAVEDAAKWTGREAVQAGKAIGGAASTIGHGAVAGAKAVGGAVEDAGSWVGGKAKDLWDWL